MKTEIMEYEQIINTTPMGGRGILRHMVPPLQTDDAGGGANKGTFGGHCRHLSARHRRKRHRGGRRRRWSRCRLSSSIKTDLNSGAKAARSTGRNSSRGFSPTFDARCTIHDAGSRILILIHFEEMENPAYTGHTIAHDYLTALGVPHTEGYTDRRFAGMPFHTLFGLTRLRRSME